MFGAKNQRADQEEEEMAVELRAKTHEKRGPIAICADGEAVRLSAATRQGDEKYVIYSLGGVSVHFLAVLVYIVKSKVEVGEKTIASSDFDNLF